MLWEHEPHPQLLRVLRRVAYAVGIPYLKLQSWPELLGHKGNKPVKMTYFLPPPPPDAMLMSGIQVIFGRLNIAWGKGGQKKWFTKTTLSALFKGSIQSFILIVHFRS